MVAVPLVDLRDLTRRVRTLCQWHSVPFSPPSPLMPPGSLGRNVQEITSLLDRLKWEPLP